MKAKKNDVASDLKVLIPSRGETGWQVIPSSAGRAIADGEVLGRARGTSHPILGRCMGSSRKDGCRADSDSRVGRSQSEKRGRASRQKDQPEHGELDKVPTGNAGKALG